MILKELVKRTSEVTLHFKVPSYPFSSFKNDLTDDLISKVHLSHNQLAVILIKEPDFLSGR